MYTEIRKNALKIVIKKKEKKSNKKFIILIHFLWNLKKIPVYPTFLKQEKKPNFARAP